MVKRYGNLYQFDAQTINVYGYDSLIYSSGSLYPQKGQAYKLRFKARANAPIKTYVYGNNYQGTYVDNGHPWQLTNQWKDYEQFFPIESVPVQDGLRFDFRAIQPLQGEIADIQFIPV